MTPDKFERILMARLKFKHLKLLMTVGEQRNIFKAAQQLNMAQPAATKTIRDLENALELELFNRSSRGVTPTRYGDIVIKHAKLILSQVKHASEELASLQGGLAGRVTVGTLLAASATLLPMAITKLKQERPNVSISIIEGTVDKLLGGLRMGDIDIVVGRLPRASYEEGVASEVLYHEPFVVTARANHPLANQESVSMDELMEQEWILPPQETNLRHEIDEALQQAGYSSPANAVESVSMLANRTLLLESNMVAAMPYQVVQAYTQAGLLVMLPVSLKTAAGPIGVTLRQNSELSPAADFLLDKIREAAEDIKVNQPQELFL